MIDLQIQLLYPIDDLQLVGNSKGYSDQYQVFKRSQVVGRVKNDLNEESRETLALLYFNPDSEINGIDLDDPERENKVKEMKEQAIFKFTCGDKLFERTNWCLVDHWFSTDVESFQPYQLRTSVSAFRLERESYCDLMGIMKERGYERRNKGDLYDIYATKKSKF